MSVLILSFLTSMLVTLLAVRSAGSHARLSADHDTQGPQKFHSRPVPRIGGVGILTAMVAGGLLLQWQGIDAASGLWLLLAAGMPAFLAGLVEDLTKTMSPRRRLFATAVSASLAVFLFDATIMRTDIPGVDALIAVYPIAVALTIFVVAGVANAVNIIDGFNGLASMCVLLMLLALAYVANESRDSAMLLISLISVGAVLGFFVWNFPAGLIFMGDGGAYFLGFVLAELSILLLNRNPAVSPMFPLLLCAYPIFETIFTMYRRKVVRGVAVGAPDGIHLHTLVHRRLIRWDNGTSAERRQTARNSMTSPYLWLLCLSSVIPAVLWWSSTPILATFLVLFMAGYVLLYWSIVRFRTPKWLFFRR
jgi:UDP-N-acetylmuramyl pentapeptide phosphotransferase/UDP-N-acetylglucosamine-1-phosphate transferase